MYVSKYRYPARCKSGVNRNRRGSDHEYAGCLDRIDVHHTVRRGAGKMKRGRIDQLRRGLK